MPFRTGKRGFSVNRSIWRSLASIAVISTLIVLAAWPVGATSAAPRKKNAYDVGFETFEPTLGATSNGDLYFSITPESVAIGWSASIAKSTDGGRSWKDVGPRLPTGHTNPPETNDPYIYVDPSTDRVFTFHMAPILTCSVLSYSDDGGRTWQSNPRGCSPTVVWDHQTIVAAKPRGTETQGYPNVLHQCVNAVYAAMCSRSLDGGLTWGPSVPVYVNTDAVDTLPNPCGAQHGHLTSSPDGRVYLPTGKCGTKPMVYISDDDGSTWRQSIISNKDTPMLVDPSVSVDSKGNLYAAFLDESGWLYYATSRNNGKSWSKPVRIANGYTTHMPVIVAGDPGRAVVAYPATNDLPKGYATKDYDGPGGDFSHVSWGANFTVTTDGLAKHPTFKTTVATGSDPLGRGKFCRGNRCAYLVDFIEAVIGPDGRPYASFADGCLGDCAKNVNGPQKTGRGVGLLTTLSSGPKLCRSVCWRYKRAAKSQMDAATALDFALSPAQEQISLEHATLSAEEKALMKQAAQRRLEAFEN